MKPPSRGYWLRPDVRLLAEHRPANGGKSSRTVRNVPTLTFVQHFGTYDEDLLRLAAQCGYVGGVTLDRLVVSAGDSIMALPRFLVTDAAWGRGFAAMLPSESP